MRSLPSLGPRGTALFQVEPVTAFLQDARYRPTGPRPSSIHTASQGLRHVGEADERVPLATMPPTRTRPARCAHPVGTWKVGATLRQRLGRGCHRLRTGRLQVRSRRIARREATTLDDALTALIALDRDEAAAQQAGARPLSAWHARSCARRVSTPRPKSSALIPQWVDGLGPRSLSVGARKTLSSTDTGRPPTIELVGTGRPR